MRTCVSFCMILSVVLPACSGDGSSSGPPEEVAELGGADARPGLDSSEGDARAAAPDADVAAEVVTRPSGATAFVATSAEQLIDGPVSAGVIGDVIMRNEVVRFAIRNQKPGLYSPYGGALVDADLVRAEGEPGAESFLELFPMTGMARVFLPKEMEIVDDGSETGTAVVRFQGTDGGMALVDSLFPMPAVGLDVTVDYILEPGAHHLEIVTRLHNPKRGVTKVDVGQFLQFSSRTNTFADNCGQSPECLLSNSTVRWLASGSERVSYGVTVPAPESIRMLLSFDKLSLLSGGLFAIEPGAEVTTRQFFIVGSGTIEEIRARSRAIRGEGGEEEVRVQVTLSDQWSQAADTWIRVRKSGPEPNNWISATTPDQKGEARLHLKPGLYDFHLALKGSQELVQANVEVVAGGDNLVALTANPVGWLRVAVADDQGNPIHAALTLQPGANAGWTAGVNRYLTVRHGETVFPVLPGAYTATVARGLLWTIDRRNVTVTAGQMVDLTATIHEAVDTTGYLMMNSHEHSEWSIDSSVPEEDRIFNALANGIEVMTPTDHDFFGTRQPAIERLGVEAEVVSALGCEVSPLWGHTTAAHCATPPPYPTYFAIQYMLYDDQGKSIRPTTASEIYQQAREQFGCFFLAVNHPYRGGATFSTYAITATSDPADAEPDLDLHLVDALEVYNKDDGLDSILEENLPAWFNLLNRGYSIAAIGGSDEHHYRGNYGNPRNMVKSTTDNPGEAVLDELYQNIKEFRSLVVGGPVIRLTVDGKEMGATVTATGESVKVHLLVEAPDWMGLEFTRVVMNGETVKEFVPVASGKVQRLDESFTVELPSDGWLVALAGSSLPEHEMVPVAGKQPLSVTNPLFIDADGDGYQAIHANGAPWDAQ